MPLLPSAKRIPDQSPAPGESDAEVKVTSLPVVPITFKIPFTRNPVPASYSIRSPATGCTVSPNETVTVS